MEQYTMQAAATYLGVSYASIRNYMKAGRLVPDGRIGRNWLFNQATLDAFVPPSKKGGRPHKPKE